LAWASEKRRENKKAKLSQKNIICEQFRLIPSSEKKQVNIMSASKSSGILLITFIFSFNSRRNLLTLNAA